jgi:hypothetical protein
MVRNTTLERNSMKMHHASRFSGARPCEGEGSYGSRLFHLSHIIALFFWLSQKSSNKEHICKLILIGNNGYHGYPSPFVVALVGTKDGRY